MKCKNGDHEQELAVGIRERPEGCPGEECCVTCEFYDVSRAQGCMKKDVRQHKDVPVYHGGVKQEFTGHDEVLDTFIRAKKEGKAPRDPSVAEPEKPKRRKK